MNNADCDTDLYFDSENPEVIRKQAVIVPLLVSHLVQLLGMMQTDTKTRATRSRYAEDSIHGGL